MPIRAIARTKQALTEFVLEAEGELAAALEAYAADQSRESVGIVSSKI